MTAGREITLDFETYYDDEYSLRKMPTPSYILDQHFECQLVSVAENDDDPYIVEGPDFHKWITDAQPTREDTATVTFNALFDNSILAWRYGYVPHRMIDAMGMARATLGHELASFNLDAVATHLKIPVATKGDFLKNVKGKRFAELRQSPLWSQFCKYALDDTLKARAIRRELGPRLPEDEFRLMDLVLRACVVPRFHTDREVLVNHIERCRTEKQALLNAAALLTGNVNLTSRDHVMSSKMFCAALTEAGIEIEMKPAPKQDPDKPLKMIPAIAKTDEFMQTLQDHEDPAVQALAAARIGNKSTLEETRALTMLEIASLPWAVTSGPTWRSSPSQECFMPIPLRYAGAHTLRLSGEWKMNMQNLPRNTPARRSELRHALIAPPGHKVVVADLGQIEPRLTAWICGELGLLQKFRDGVDTYCAMASNIFDKPVTKADTLERFIGKGAVLGLGYQMAAPKFYISVVREARKQKISLGNFWTPELAEKSVEIYRAAHPHIKRAWKILDRAMRTVWLNFASDFGEPTVKFGPVEISHGRIDLPNGTALLYGHPRQGVYQQNNRDKFEYTYGRKTHPMYGAKMLENIVQALAKIIVMNAALRLASIGLDFVLQAHDELVFIVPDAAVDLVKEIVHREMTRPVSWALDLPLIADVGSGQSYGAAK